MDFNFLEPVDHILVRAGFCSDRSFNTFIYVHKVEIKRTGAGVIPVTDRILLFDSEYDLLFIDDAQVSVPKHLYVLLNKPMDVVCSRVSDSHKTVFDFLSDEIKSHPLYEHLHIAGRLDADSRGLVLLTTNGSFSATLVKPDAHVMKIYRVTLRDSVDEASQLLYKKAFRSGIYLPPEKKAEGFRTKKADLNFISENEAVVKISEGKFHQVRRMFAALENEVTDLQRTAIGEISLSKKLSEGEFEIWKRP